MLKAVIDTNVVLSGSVARGGIPFEVLEAWRRGDFVVLVRDNLAVGRHRCTISISSPSQSATLGVLVLVVWASARREILSKSASPRFSLMNTAAR